MRLPRWSQTGVVRRVRCAAADELLALLRMHGVIPSVRSKAGMAATAVDLYKRGVITIVAARPEKIARVDDEVAGAVI